MSTNPNANADIHSYYQAMVAAKQRADMPLADAKAVATAQIHSETKAGRLDREAAIEWLITRHMEVGGTREAAERFIRADFPEQAS